MTEHIDHIPTAADAESDAFDDDIVPEASSLAASLFWGFAAVALVLLPVATLPGKRPLGWMQEPWSWPFIVLTVGLIGGFPQLRALIAARKAPGFPARAATAFEGMGRSLIYAAAFLAYLGGVALLGFTLASILFMQALYALSGLRGWRWRLTALAVTVVIVLAFRVGLGIWFPLPPVMQLFPDWVGIALGDYL